MMPIWNNALPGDELHLGFKLRATPPANWWVCRMYGVGWVCVQSDTRPHGALTGQDITIPAGSYDVLYGGATELECAQFVKDLC
jgi:hypothetical protein